MDDAYYRYPAGSTEHWEAYLKEFKQCHGIGYVFPDDAWASYEVDNAYELAALDYEDPEPDDGIMDEDAERGGGGCTFHPEDLSIDAEPEFLWPARPRAAHRRQSRRPRSRSPGTHPAPIRNFGQCGLDPKR
jgi:hypothetical protein